MTEIAHEIKIKAAPEKVFTALSTANGLKGWYSAHVEGDGKPGHTWRFGFTERPTFRWEVTEFDLAQEGGLEVRRRSGGRHRHEGDCRALPTRVR